MTGIETLLKWSAPVQVVTKRGDRILRKAKPTPEFEALYQARRREFNDIGVTLGEYKGKREVCWWAELPAAHVAEKAERVAASRAIDADVDLPIAEGCEYRPYQKAGIVFALECFKKYGGCLIADDMGIGKTATSIGVINAEPKIQRVLVLCTNALKINWSRELRRFLARPLSIGIGDSTCFPTTDIVVLNYDCVGKFERSLSLYWDLVILDEVHNLKNPKAQRTKAVLGYRPTREEREAGVEAKTSIPTRRKLALTGTPIQNKPIEIFSMLNWIDPTTWKSRFDFGRTYCGCPKPKKMRGKSIWDFSGASNTDQLQAALRSTFMIRRMKVDVMDDLPPKIRQIIVLPADGLEGLIADERKIEGRWEAKIEAMRENAQQAQATSNNAEYAAVADQMKLRRGQSQGNAFEMSHKFALAKVPLITEHLLEVLEEEQKKVLLFAHHLDVIDKYFVAFKAFNPVKIIGGDIGARQRAIDRFQNDPTCRIIVAGIQAAKEGLNLTAAELVAFAELDYVPGTMSQCEDRAWRSGQRNSVLVLHFVLAGSNDVAKVQSLVRKQEVIEQALDRRAAGEQAPAQAQRPAPPAPRPAPARPQPRAWQADETGQLLLV